MTRIELVYTVIPNMVRELNNIPDLRLPEFFLSYPEKDHMNKNIYRTRTTEESSKLEFLIQQAYELYLWI